MNALYVTVSVPLLLILAGFNHAHGLTTFGKSNAPQQNSPPSIQGKLCTNHSDCQRLNGTSCVTDQTDSSKKRCLCGNNQGTDNGACPNVKKGQNHICTKDDDCINGAQCEQSAKESLKICVCNGDCSGASLGNTISSMALILMLACRIVY